MTVISKYLLVAAMVGAWLHGFTVAKMVPRNINSAHVRVPTEMTAGERASFGVKTRTEPMSIMLRIVPEDELTRGAENVLVSPGYRLAAWASTNSDPCEITIPAGWEIISSPVFGRAAWADRADGDKLAHEILHCLRGSWHDDWITVSRRVEELRK